MIPSVPASKEGSVPLRSSGPAAKCRYCGRFVSLAKAVIDFTPDTIYTYERTDFYHRACWDLLGCIPSAKPPKQDVP